MSRVTIKDKTFETSIPEAEILKRVKAVAARINQDLADKNPIFIAVLNGSFVFAADLMREINFPAEITFIRVKEVMGLKEDITGRHVVIVEDIVDTGTTMKQMISQLEAKNPASIHVCTLLLKPGKLKVPLNIEYAAMEIPNDFIVGYGLDYDQLGRGLRDIYTLVSE